MAGRVKEYQQFNDELIYCANCRHCATKINLSDKVGCKQGFWRDVLGRNRSFAFYSIRWRTRSKCPEYLPMGEEGEGDLEDFLETLPEDREDHILLNKLNNQKNIHA